MKKVSLQQKRKTLNMEAEAYTQMDVFIFVPFFVFKANFKQMDIQSIRNSKSFPYTQLTSIAIYLILKGENFFLQILVHHTLSTCLICVSVHSLEHKNLSRFY